MSLVGNLEELGLGEILQIVSLSRNTGVLSLKSRGREGSVYFRHGQVVKASSSTYQQSLGELLIQKGAIDLPVLRKALTLQQEQGFRELLGVILVKNFGVSQEIIEDVVREQIESTVYSLFAWVEGSYDFVVHEDIETVDDTRLDPLQFILGQGLNPQILAMEATRVLDGNPASPGTVSAQEKSPDTGDRSSGPADSSVGGVSPAPAAQRQIVIVDDDAPTLRALSDGLAENGFAVHALNRSEDALIKVDTLHRGGGRPIVLIDLIMPRMDGSGVLGGLELLEILKNNFADLQIIVMTDYQHADAEDKVREMGFPFVIKPRRIEIGSVAAVNGFLTQLCGVINGEPDALPESGPRDRFDLSEELRSVMGADYVPVSGGQLSPGNDFSLLRGMLEELNNPDLQGGVLLLVLRFASEFLNRAIVFTLNDTVISGSGQFGISGGKSGGDEKVRSICIPLESESMFTEPFRTGRPHVLKPGHTKVNTRLFEQLGGGVPDEVFISPLISRSRTIGFLYGDNQPHKKPIGNIESLAIFISQAGIVMEKSVLERQLNERVTA